MAGTEVSTLHDNLSVSLDLTSAAGYGDEAGSRGCWDRLGQR